MVHPSRCRRVLLTAVAIVAAMPMAPVSAADGRGRIRGDLRSEYTDNLYHFSDLRLDEFGTANDPGERFDDIEDTSDVVTRLRLRTDYAWKLAKHRDLRLFLNGSWFQHLEHGVVDYG